MMRFMWRGMLLLQATRGGTGRRGKHGGGVARRRKFDEKLQKDTREKKGGSDFFPFFRGVRRRRGPIGHWSHGRAGPTPARQQYHNRRRLTKSDNTPPNPATQQEINPRGQRSKDGIHKRRCAGQCESKEIRKAERPSYFVSQGCNGAGKKKSLQMCTRKIAWWYQFFNPTSMSPPVAKLDQLL